jgi:molybdate transport system substrate-binding protein
MTRPCAGRALAGRFVAKLLPALLALGAFLPVGALAGQLTISAAASLTNAFGELGRAFEAETPGVSVRLNLGASGVLLQQLAQGAPVDVFASADQETMDRAAKRFLIDEATRIDFATNAVVLVEPAVGGSGLGSLQDLDRPRVRRIAIGKPLTVPAGRYARDLLERADLLPRLEPKLIQADSVRQVLDYVARGEVEAGFVYRTDAAVMKNKVRIVIEAATDPPVSYPVAVVAASRAKEAAGRFVAFLASPAARRILERHGFGAP